MPTCPFSYLSSRYLPLALPYSPLSPYAPALPAASRSFQLRIALKPRKKLPWVSQRQYGRFANMTTWPLPSGTSMTTARPASASPPTNIPLSSMSSAVAGKRRTTRGSMFAEPPATRTAFGTHALSLAGAVGRSLAGALGSSVVSRGFSSFGVGFCPTPGIFGAAAGAAPPQPTFSTGPWLRDTASATAS